MRFVTDGVARVQELVGDGTLRGQVVVDQAYAQNQHETVWFKHPHGGQAHFLSEPLLSGASFYLERIARGLLDDGPVTAMRGVTEDLCEQVRDKAPRDHGYLRESAQPFVYDDGKLVYTRPPAQRRLTDEELDARGRGVQH